MIPFLLLLLRLLCGCVPCNAATSIATATATITVSAIIVACAYAVVAHVEKKYFARKLFKGALAVIEVTPAEKKRSPLRPSLLGLAATPTACSTPRCLLTESEEKLKE